MVELSCISRYDSFCRGRFGRNLLREIRNFHSIWTVYANWLFCVKTFIVRNHSITHSFHKSQFNLLSSYLHFVPVFPFQCSDLAP